MRWSNTCEGNGKTVETGKELMGWKSRRHWKKGKAKGGDEEQVWRERRLVRKIAQQEEMKSNHTLCVSSWYNYRPWLSGRDHDYYTLTTTSLLR